METLRLKVQNEILIAKVNFLGQRIKRQRNNAHWAIEKHLILSQNC